jgi:hypothetical protein
MKGDGFGTDEVVAARNGGGDDSSPAAVVCDHLACSPHALGNCTAQKTRFFDLELIIVINKTRVSNDIEVNKAGSENSPIERSEC